jgi:putative cell wall-binding protein
MDGDYDPLYCSGLNPDAMTVGGTFCFGGPTIVQACSGDSGGPLIGLPSPDAEDGDLTVYGVVSYGPAFCGNNQESDKAQAVSGNTNWINDIVRSITGSTDIVILGGTSAVSSSVASRLASCTDGWTSRISGSNRYATAAAVSDVFLEPPTNVVYVATGANFPDALAGSAAAGSGSGGPVLLVKQNSIPSETAQELSRLEPDAIVVLGGTAAISQKVANALRSYGSVVRVAGSDRYSTGALVSQFAFPAGADTAYVATGTNFPDALGGGPTAVVARGPVLLVKQDSIPSSVRTELARLGLTNIKILGGTAAISSSVAADLRAYASNVERLSGSNRYSTGAAVSRDTFAPGVNTLFITTGANFPDALAGGPIAGILGGPVLLVQQDSIPGATETEIERLTGVSCSAS